MLNLPLNKTIARSTLANTVAIEFLNSKTLIPSMKEPRLGAIDIRAVPSKSAIELDYKTQILIYGIKTWCRSSRKSVNKRRIRYIIRLKSGKMNRKPAVFLIYLG